MVRGPGLPEATPFQRLGRVHALMIAGEAIMAVSLADSLFLSISPDAARTQVILFLAMSMAPFALLAPLIAPFLDKIKGGQRLVVMMVALARGDDRDDELLRQPCHLPTGFRRTRTIKNVRNQ
jgi:hypothetical protein